jgi:molybdopterin molybdotransferase
MISVDQAWSRILKTVSPPAHETIPITECRGRTLAQDITSKCTTPADDTSAMDGYAVRHDDLKPGCTLALIGEAPAGSPFEKPLQKGQCVRIFTGGIVPQGADTVVIQENTSADGAAITIHEVPPKGRNIRKKGMDFSEGDGLVPAGKVLNERDLALIAGGNHGEIPVYKRPQVAIIPNGDELVVPGTDLKPGDVINSNTPALKALIEGAGAEVIMGDIVPDSLKAIEEAFDQAKTADAIVTLGGASVGDYDYVLEAFQNAGGTQDFWKVAMKPGKPLMFGELDGKTVLGLPGNPNSAYVTAFLFLLPVLKALQGQSTVKPQQHSAVAGADIPENGDRELFLLAKLDVSDETGAFIASLHPRQDSARMSTLQASNALIRRAAHQAASAKGDPVQVLPLP